MTLPAAGWFPDPRDGTRLRWWDGRTWSDATRAEAVRTESFLPLPQVVASAPAFSVHAATAESRTWAYGSTTRRFCAFSCSALLLALASLVRDPWGVLSLLALVTGLVGVLWPRGTGGWRVAGRSIAVSAMVLAVATALVAWGEGHALF